MKKGVEYIGEVKEIKFPNKGIKFAVKTVKL